MIVGWGRKEVGKAVTSAEWVSAVVGRGCYSVPAMPCSPEPRAQMLRRVRKRRFKNDILSGVVAACL